MAWQPSKGISLSDAFYEVMKKITQRDWARFARSALRLEQHEIDEIKTDYPRNAKEQKYQMLELWKQKVGSSVSVEYLYGVLNHYLFPDDCPSPVLRKKVDTSKEADDIPSRSMAKDRLSPNPAPTIEPDAKVELAEYCSKVEHVDVRPCAQEFLDVNARMDSNYKRTFRKGKALIVNNSFIHCSESYREGSEVDVENLKNLWEKIGCDVQVHTDLHASDLMTILRNFSDACGQGYDYCVIFVMSHGCSDNGCDVVLGNDGEKVFVKEILEMYNNVNSPHLQGIPKLFFFQCCRGLGKDLGVAADGSTTAPVQPQTPQSRVLPESQLLVPGVNRGDIRVESDAGPTFMKLPTVSDMLISYATQSGQQAFRNTANGCWFINAIANVFMRDAKDEHVLDMMVKVNKAVAEKSASDDGAKSMSHIEFTLTKKLYLYP